MQRLVLGKPPPSCPRQGNALFHTMGKEKQQETKRNINMKYAQLPLCTREGEENGSGWAAWEPLLGQRILRDAAGTAGGAWGTQRGPSHLRALMRSLFQPWKSSLPWLKPRKHLGLDHRHPGWKTASGKYN